MTRETSGLQGEGIVQSSATCQRCGYNLRGLHRDGLCPECAFPVAASLVTLITADAAWLNDLRSACVAGRYATLLGLLTLGAFSLAWVFAPVEVLGWVALLVGGIFELAACITLATREPGSEYAARQQVLQRQFTGCTLGGVFLVIVALGTAVGAPQGLGGMFPLPLLIGAWMLLWYGFSYRIAMLGSLLERTADEAGVSRCRVVSRLCVAMAFAWLLYVAAWAIEHGTARAWRWSGPVSTGVTAALVVFAATIGLLTLRGYAGVIRETVKAPRD